MSAPVISLENATLRLRLHGMKGAQKKDKSDVGQERVQHNVGGRIIRGIWGSHVLALDGLTLDVFDGDRVALIGHNGAGKTSLLRMLAGIYSPSEGKCIIRGKQSCLLSVGLGLNGDATLTENIRLALALYGTDFKEIDGMIPEILDFAELTEFADMPLHACSNGMRARLGFSVSTSVSPDVFLVDEAIGAGDASFAKKAKARIDSIFKQSRVLILSAHSNRILSQFCNKALWLEKGRMRAFGPLDDILAEYDVASGGSPTKAKRLERTKRKKRGAKRNNRKALVN